MTLFHVDEHERLLDFSSISSVSTLSRDVRDQDLLFLKRRHHDVQFISRILMPRLEVSSHETKSHQLEIFCILFAHSQSSLRSTTFVLWKLSLITYTSPVSHSCNLFLLHQQWIQLCLVLYSTIPSSHSISSSLITPSTISNIMSALLVAPVPSSISRCSFVVLPHLLRNHSSSSPSLLQSTTSHTPARRPRNIPSQLSCSCRPLTFATRNYDSTRSHGLRPSVLSLTRTRVLHLLKLTSSSTAFLSNNSSFTSLLLSVSSCLSPPFRSCSCNYRRAIVWRSFRAPTRILDISLCIQSCPDHPAWCTLSSTSERTSLFQWVSQQCQYIITHSFLRVSSSTSESSSFLRVQRSYSSCLGSIVLSPTSSWLCSWTIRRTRLPRWTPSVVVFMIFPSGSTSSCQQDPFRNIIIHTFADVSSRRS